MLKNQCSKPIAGRMSIDAVVARIDQILAAQEQLRSGRAFSPAPAGATAPAARTAAGATSFSHALNSALAPQSATDATNEPQQVQAMTNMADSLLGKPYVVGGGHAGFGSSSGYDCSGFVSALLHAGGFLSQPVDTTALPNPRGL